MLTFSIRSIGGLLAVLLLILLPSSLANVGSAHAQGGIDPAKLRGLLGGSAQLVTPIGTSDLSGLSSFCSATVLDTAGFLLTNFHCIGATNDTQYADQGLHKGDFKEPDGLSIVLITDNPRNLPKPMYVAKVLTGDPDLDLAVLKIQGFFSGKLNLDDPTGDVLPLTTIDLGNSDNVQIDDSVTVLGYPSVGGNTLTLTDGKISGFLNDSALPGVTAWFKTDALVNHGNSGGTALNAQAAMIGIPTQKEFDSTTGDTIFTLRPVNFAVPFIDQAHKLAGTTNNPDPNQIPNPNPNSNPNPSGAATLGAVVFGTGFDNATGKALNPGASFPSGTAKVHTAVPFQNVKGDTLYIDTWLLNGKVATAAAPSAKPWTFGTAGTVDFNIGAPADSGGLSDGTWSFQLALKGGPTTQGKFTIGSSAPPSNKPKPPQPPTQGVTVKGQLVDADTGEPIANGLFLVLKPGITVAAFFDAAAANQGFEIMVQATGNTDAQGMFVVTTPLARNKSYSAAVAGKGYLADGADNFLKIDASTPSVLQLKPIGLTKSQ